MMRLHLRGLDIFRKCFPAMLMRKTTFVTYHLLFCTSNPFLKGSSLKGKNLVTRGANSILLE